MINRAAAHRACGASGRHREGPIARTKVRPPARARGAALSAFQSSDRARRLVEDAASLEVALTEQQAAALLGLLEALERWNRRYNLTAIPSLEAMVTHHLLDSLAVSADLAGERIADAGTGAGFPGLPLAVCNPQRHFTLIDSTAKKIRFVSHAAALLGLTNVTAVHARVEALAVEAPFDTVVARAFAPLARLLAQVSALCDAHSRVLAMKGKWPQAELAALPVPWRVIGSRELAIPRLGAARCVIVLARGSGYDVS
jgi:16S rRNA (guanine527-N7)-methyltransferase